MRSLSEALLDLTVLHDEVLNILLAGRDTVGGLHTLIQLCSLGNQTATTLTFTIYLLSMHPDVLKRLRAEVLEKVGPKQRPTYADIKEMRYLRAVINETLRLYPAVLVSPSLTVILGSTLIPYLHVQALQHPVGALHT